MRLILVNGVYGSHTHLGTLCKAFAPEVSTEVFSFERQGAPDPRREDAFQPMVRRLDQFVRASSDIAADAAITASARPAMLGFSLGGALALEYALHHTDRLSGLVLVNSFDRYHLGGLRAGAMPPVWRVPVPIVHHSVMSRVVHRVDWLRRGLFHDEATVDDVDRGMRSATDAVTSEDLSFQLAHLGLPLPRGQSERLAALAERLPVLLVSSRHDMVVAPFHTDRLARLMPAARRVPPFDGGHAFFQHDATALAAAVRPFLGELPS